MVESSKEENFIQIEVRNPRTHISREKALYTDYEIVVKTNNIAFATNESSVRRRYSDFQWLRTRLINQYQLVTSPPELPPKRLFGRFQRQFLKRRQAGLQKFLERVVEDNQYLSDVAIHLFLQSSFPIKEIERYLDGIVGEGDLVESLQSIGDRKQSGLSRSMAEIPQFETPIENDSGCYYSTTSSVNDLMHSPVAKTQDNWRYYMSVPANLDKVAANETEEPTIEVTGEEPGRLLQVDSGHLTSGSQQSLHRQTLSSESDCDYIGSFEYDADDESDLCFLEGSIGSVDLVFHSQILPVEEALQILLTRPKISERILATDDDTDEEFHESEYDVIDSDNEEFASRSRRKSSSSSKKKLSRSLSDVKLRRRPSRSSMNKENECRPSFQSMPNIRVPIAKKTRKSSKGLQFKALAVHKEDPEKIKINIEGFTTSGSVSKCNKSDEADESFVPNSEMDCYSTWNSPPKMMNGNLDSSEIEASSENYLEIKPRSTHAARDLFKRIVSKHEHRLYDELSTRISGRFRVSAIKEEENTSRRGSASSNELTLRQSLFRDIQTTKVSSEPVTPVGELRSFDKQLPPELSDVSGASSVVFCKEPQTDSEECVPNYEKKNTPVTESEPAQKFPTLLSLAENILETRQLLSDESLTIKNDCQLPAEDETHLPIKDDDVPHAFNDPLIMNNTDDVVDIATKEDDKLAMDVADHEKIVDENSLLFVSDNIDNISQTQESSEKTYFTTTSEKDHQHIAQDTISQTKTNSGKTRLLETAEVFFGDCRSSEKVLHLLGLNGNLYKNDSMFQFEKARAVSPTHAVLGTYDVIPDVATCILEDYDILSDKRE